MKLRNYLPAAAEGTKTIMTVARAGGLSYIEAAALPYDTFLAILLTSNADGLSEMDRHAEELKKLKDKS